MTTTSCAFTFDRTSNGILRISRDTVLYTVLTAGPRPAEEEVEGPSTTRKEGVGDSRIRWSVNGCRTGAGDEATDLLNHPVRVGGLELARGHRGGGRLVGGSRSSSVDSETSSNIVGGCSSCALVG